MKVAFLGTGAMGNGIASNILEAGYDLTVWNLKDPFWANVEKLVEKGAKSSDTIQEAVKDADIIGMSLVADFAVKDVCGKVAETVKEGAVIFDCSTVSPDCEKEMEALFEKEGAYYLDAPVSGGIGGAEAGTLTVMIGGDYDAYKKAEPVFKSFSGTYNHMGKIGNGQVTKLINQLLTGVNQATVCEAMLIAEKADLDMEKLFNLLTVSWGSSRMLDRSVPEYIIPKKFESAACLQLMLKDLKLTLEMAESVGYKVPITETAVHFYDQAKEEGIGKEDHSAIIKIMEKENKL